MNDHSDVGASWSPAKWRREGDDKAVYVLAKIGSTTRKTRVGVLGSDGRTVTANGQVVGEYRKPGIFPEVAVYVWRQIAEVWTLDNEFVARWASYAYDQDHRDMKVLLAAFMLVQNRFGFPVKGEDGKVLFYDDDFRDVGEAMCLIKRKDGKDIGPKHVLRLFDVLRLPQVVAINREIGFGHSARVPFYGRLRDVVRKWLLYRERNLPLFEGLVKAGFRQTVMEMARKVGYKPETPKFFSLLRWKQGQSKDGRRSIAVGVAVEAAESWEGLAEREICERIVRDKPSWKRIVGLLPPGVGLTRAIMAASVESGAMSDADLIILTPTLEDLGLLLDADVRRRWDQAVQRAENQRAANIASRVRSKGTADKLQEASDKAVAKAVEEVTKDMRVYVFVDKSGSMEGAIDRAKDVLAKFLQGFPLERLHVATFNTVGKEINVRHRSAAGVAQAFRGEAAGGGTSYAAAVRCLAERKPGEGEDSLFLFVGDQADGDVRGLVMSTRASGLRPTAFGMLDIVSNMGPNGTVVEEAARELGIPCFKVDEGLFDDPYAVTRVLRDLIASTPVGVAPFGSGRVSRRSSLIEAILKTDILKKPAWA